MTSADRFVIIRAINSGVLDFGTHKYLREKVFTMAEKKNILTYEGLRKLEEEVEYLKVVRRKEVSKKLQEAREQGDLSENAEYDAAKDEQRDIEARIEDIEKILKNAEVVLAEEADPDKVSIGSKVTILDVEEDEEMEYKIVGSTEVDSLRGKISSESPVGSALMGRTAGETVVAEIKEEGKDTIKLEYKILKVEKDA